MRTRLARHCSVFPPAGDNTANSAQANNAAGCTGERAAVLHEGPQICRPVCPKNGRCGGGSLIVAKPARVLPNCFWYSRNTDDS